MAAVRRWRPVRNRTIPRVLVAACVVALAVVATVGLTLWSARQDAWRNASVASENLALTVARAVEGSMAFYDRSLTAAAQRLAASGAGIERDARGQAILDGLVVPLDLGPIAITDATGRIIAISRSVTSADSSVAAREFFLRSRDTDDDGPQVSRPFKPGGVGPWSIAVSRRLLRPDGTFDGIVMGTLPVSYFRELIEKFNGRHLGSIDLLRQDGILLAGTPTDEQDIGRDVREAPSRGGTARPGDEGVSPNEPRARRVGDRSLYSYSKVGTLPLVITVATSTAEVFTEWRRHAVVLCAIAITLVATLLFGTVALRRELARRLAAEGAARDNAMRYQLLADNSSDIILRLDRAGVQRYVSPSVEEILGYPAGTLIGRNWHELADPQDHAALAAALGRLREDGGRTSLQYRCKHRDGPVLWVEASLRLVRDGYSDEPFGAIATIRDVTWRKQAEDELAEAAGKLAILAATDGLTGLANRRCFDETLQREWRRARRGATPLALLMLDADWFKSFNDRYGHQKGDDALRAISACIIDTIKRPGDLGARYGGEEFAVVLPGIDEPGAVNVAQEIRGRLAALAVPHDGSPAGMLTVSIGIAALVVHAGDGPAELVAAADAALYAAKRAGRDRAVTHSGSLLTLAAD